LASFVAYLDKLLKRKGKRKEKKGRPGRMGRPAGPAAHPLPWPTLPEPVAGQHQHQIDQDRSTKPPTPGAPSLRLRAGRRKARPQRLPSWAAPGTAQQQVFSFFFFFLFFFVFSEVNNYKIRTVSNLNILKFKNFFETEQLLKVIFSNMNIFGICNNLNTNLNKFCI
jgi:hypothetical protein